MSEDLDLSIATLGESKHPSPLHLSTVLGDHIADFTPADATIAMDPVGGDSTPRFELAGPRQKNFFKGPDVVAGVVSCGGLCPGMNNVIRSLVLQLWHNYGVQKVFGLRYGFEGLSGRRLPPFELTPDRVKHINYRGGTILGSSRGPVDPREMIATLKALSINVIFCIGGDGTMRGTQALYQEITRQGLEIAVIGVPKTIDNDIPFIERTFGFETAVSIAAQAIIAAHVEATGAPKGLGLVRLMGRHSGFIAASATLATREVNLVLVPELPFSLEGEAGVLAFLRQRLQRHDHAVVVVAEGAGQELLEGVETRDASGNKQLADIGIHLKGVFRRRLADAGINLKYIDPSYIIRAAPANPGDAIFCGQLAEDAVHAAMAGKTGMVVGLWLSRFTHVPLAAVTSNRKLLSMDGPLWRNVVDATGQPALFGPG